MSNAVRIVPLGGLGEVGRNMMAIEYEEQMLLVDCGLMFPQNDMFGIDIVLPDMRYVWERQDRLRGIVITHGHEDHLGALPYLLRGLDNAVPIFATPLTAGLIAMRAREHRVSRRAQLDTIAGGMRRQVGPFEIEFIHVAHSIPDTVALAIRTPVGLIVHTSEYKLDMTPYSGAPTDLQRFAQLGHEGVLLLMADSTNADKPGRTPSEQLVSQTLDHIFAQTTGRILVSTFASNLMRAAQVIETAQRYGRRVGVAGRSMEQNIRLAIEMGYLPISQDELLPAEAFESAPPHEVCILCTGTQGEPMSALVRMARGEYPHLAIRPGDTVVLSAHTIPGNEELVNRTINRLFRLGARVLHPPLWPVHVSGHAARDEMRIMLDTVRPRFFMPIQGEYRHLALHADLAREEGIHDDRIILVESGTPVHVWSEGWATAPSVGGDLLFADGRRVNEIHIALLRDRLRLARGGFVVVVVPVDETRNAVVGEPHIITHGLLRHEEYETLRDILQNALRNLTFEDTDEDIETVIRQVVRQQIRQLTARRPLVYPVIVPA
nr:ribonuclease J [Ardenticatena sp.]